MKCLVSGATGFVGRQLCQRLAARGDTVIACSRTGAPLPDGTPTLGLDLAEREFDGDLYEGVDVLFHLAGYLKRKVGGEERQRLAALIEQYRTGIVPLVVPVTMLRHHFANHPNAYIDQQVFMAPYPDELQLRNLL